MVLDRYTTTDYTSGESIHRAASEHAEHWDVILIGDILYVHQLCPFAP
jgi:predicted nicotinamide N-methyase